ncbi:hypothetical protein KCU80_g21811, partial [Aureobasidium melanogenum]
VAQGGVPAAVSDIVGGVVKRSPILDNELGSGLGGVGATVDGLTSGGLVGGVSNVVDGVTGPLIGNVKRSLSTGVDSVVENVDGLVHPIVGDVL